MPPAFVDRMYDDFDGTERAVLRLTGRPDLPYPAASGWAQTLAEVDRPALIVWGADDPFLAEGGSMTSRTFSQRRGDDPEGSGHLPFADDPIPPPPSSSLSCAAG